MFLTLLKYLADMPSNRINLSGDRAGRWAFRVISFSDMLKLRNNHRILAWCVRGLFKNKINDPCRLNL